MQGKVVNIQDKGMSKLVFRVHAIKRMFQRRISEQDVRQALDKAQIVEEYPDEEPYPCKLVLGWIGSRPLHVVLADNKPDQETIIITVYEPEVAQWEPDFKRRKS